MLELIVLHFVYCGLIGAFIIVILFRLIAAIFRFRMATKYYILVFIQAFFVSILLVPWVVR
jgi:cell division protein FtsX